MTSRTLLLKVLDDLGSSLSQDRMGILLKVFRKIPRSMKRDHERDRSLCRQLPGRDPKFAMNYVMPCQRLYRGEYLGKAGGDIWRGQQVFDDRSPFSRKAGKADDKVINLRKEKGIFCCHG